VTWLAALFFLVALVYASVGFGGGSTYTALLGLWGVDYTLIPVISLLCNIIVVSGGVWRFRRAGLIDWQAVLPLLMVSAPLAFLGGLVPLKQSLFLLILGSALLASCAALLVQTENWRPRKLPKPVLLSISAAVGLLAGLSGIGGGIFIAGVGGQLMKTGAAAFSGVFDTYWPMMIAVLIGGQIGGMLGLRLFSPRILRMTTALLVGYVAVRLIGQSLKFW
jgi:uncharacterized protein